MRPFQSLRDAHNRYENVRHLQDTYHDEPGVVTTFPRLWKQLRRVFLKLSTMSMTANKERDPKEGRVCRMDALLHSELL
jgi:hypothetical protein